MISLLFGLQANAEIFNTDRCTELDWSYRWFDIGERYDGSAWDNAHLDNIEMISLRGVRQGGRKGKAIYYTSTVGGVFLEVEYTSKYENMSSMTCGGRNKLNFKRPILNKEQEIRTSYRNMRATLTSQYWEEYAPIAHNVSIINKATSGQKIGLLLSVSNHSCELRAYTAENSELKDRRKTYEYTSKGIRNYETKKPLNGCIVYSEDVQEIIQQLANLVYIGPKDKDNDMPIVPKGPPSLDKHL